MPQRPRLIARREGPYPGARLKSWSHNGCRHQVIVANQTGDAVEFDAHHRQYARGENRLTQLTNIGDCRFPLTRFPFDTAWLETMVAASLLFAGTRQLLLDGELIDAESRSRPTARPPRDRTRLNAAAPARRTWSADAVLHEDRPERRIST